MRSAGHDRLKRPGHNPLALALDIVPREAPGLVVRVLSRIRVLNRHRRPSPVDLPPRRPKRRQVAAWYLSRWDHLPRTTTRSLSLILTDPECQRVYTLTHQLHTLIRHRRGAALTPWLTAAKATKIPELVRFATSIHQDEQAVRNGCTVIWSPGIVEGFNNQIKRLKRIMYGRARFDLLRKRILLS